jgi:hypothetical protein
MLAIYKEAHETWRECAARYGRNNHLEAEVLEAFDANLRNGDDEATAAWGACYEWDVTDLAR